MNPKLKWILIFLLVVFLGVGIGLMFTPVFHVQEVFCEGNVRIGSEEICQAAADATGKNIFLVRLSTIRKQVESVPLVEHASIRRVFPNKIKIVVEECIPAGYLADDNQCVLVDTDGKILEIVADERAAWMQETYTPSESVPPETEEKKTEEKESAESTAETTDGTEAITADGLQLYAAPLVLGVDVQKPEVGKTVRCKTETQWEVLSELFDTLEQNDLLSRATCLDLRKEDALTLVIENRLEILLGKAENLEYRTAFLAKVINERISATEHAVMDYRGADIYVRMPEDGKERMKPSATPTPTETAGKKAEPKATTDAKADDAEDKNEDAEDSTADAPQPSAQPAKTTADATAEPAAGISMN